ncbi:hypothetical protein [Winogradskyella haliclonae]|nr:hypothetical protein [Winogradskyella haliclonae]
MAEIVIWVFDIESQCHILKPREDKKPGKVQLVLKKHEYLLIYFSNKGKY